MASLRASLRAAENRESEARSLQAKAEQERTSLHRKLDLATAERHMLQSVTGRMQMLQLEERAAMQAARDRAEVTHGELSVRLEAAETAALESAKSVTSIEEDRKWLSERYTLTTGQLKQVQSELNQLYEELSALNARHQALQLERASNAASAQLLEERLREVQSQRDAAESERMNLQRELCTANSRLQDADERARSAEAALSVAQSEVAVGKSELRERKALCIELERQRDAMTRQHSRLQEQLVLSLSPPTPRTIS
jgi:chromosome segregation ATPase